LWPHIAEVWERVDGGATAVQTYDVSGRDEVPQSPSERVIEPELLSSLSSRQASTILGVSGRAGRSRLRSGRR
jgi:hypothetical protein